MKPDEIIAKIKETKPELLRGVDEKAATRMLRLVFAELARQIGAAEDGVILVPGLGRFVVKTVVVEKDGVETTRKRIVFRHLPPKTVPDRPV